LSSHIIIIIVLCSNMVVVNNSHDQATSVRVRIMLHRDYD